MNNCGREGCEVLQQVAQKVDELAELFRDALRLLGEELTDTRKSPGAGRSTNDTADTNGVDSGTAPGTTQE